MVYIDAKINLDEFDGRISPYQLVHIRIYAIAKGVTNQTVRNWAKKGWIYLIEITGESTYVLSLDRRDLFPDDIHPKKWTITQVAKLLTVHQETLINWAKEGYINISSQGNSKIIFKEELYKNLFSRIKKYQH